VTAREVGQRAAGEPASVVQLVAVDDDITAGVGGDEADHHLAREGPVLAADVVDVLHVHADLFLDLARHAALQRLAVVHEAGDERVAAGGPVGLAREQHAVAVAHEHDGGRVQVGVVLVTAARALLAPLVLDARGGRAAARAVAAGRFPPERLHGHAAEGEQLVGHPRAAHGHHGLASETGGHGRLGRHRHHPARLPQVRPEPERRPAVERHRAIAGREAETGAVGRDEQGLALDEKPVATLVRGLAATLGRLERRAEDVAVERQVHAEGRRHRDHQG
jgi:hypothetical protein